MATEKVKHTQQLDRISNNTIQLGLKTGAKLTATNNSISSNKILKYGTEIVLDDDLDLVYKKYVDDLYTLSNENLTNALINRIVAGKRINTSYNSGKETLEIGLGEAYTPDFSSKFLSEAKTESVSYPVEAVKAADESYFYSYGVFTGQTDSKYGRFAAPSSDANAGMGAVISAIKVDKYGSVIGVDYKKISTSDLDNTGGAYDNYRAWILRVGDNAKYITGVNNAPKEGEKVDETFGNTFELEFAGSGITPTISSSGTKHTIRLTPYLDTQYLTMIGAEGSSNAQISHKLKNESGQDMVSTARILKATVDAAGHISSVETITAADLGNDLNLNSYGVGNNESLENGLVHGVDSAHTDSNPSDSTLFYTSEGKWARIPYSDITVSQNTNNEDIPLVAGSTNITELKRSNSATMNPLTGAIRASSFEGNGSNLTNLNAAAITTNVLNTNVLPTVPLSKGGTGKALGNNDINTILSLQDDGNGSTSLVPVQADELDGGSGNIYVLTQDKSRKENIGFQSVNDIVNNYLITSKSVRITGTIGTDVKDDIQIQSAGATVNLHELLLARQYKTGYIYRATTSFFLKDSAGESSYDYKIKNGDLIFAVKDSSDAGYPKFTVIQSYFELPDVAEGATKTEASENNGYIKINDVETKVYELPEATDSSLGGVIVDTSFSVGAQDGHVLAASLVSQEVSDIHTEISGVDTNLNTHLEDTNNPHQVTKEQVGLEYVVNASMDNDPLENSTNYVKSGGVYSAVASVRTEIGSVETNLNSHMSNTQNPHQVTKAQVGLGSVENKIMVYPENRVAVENLSEEDLSNGNYATAGLVTSYAKDIYEKITGDQEFANVIITGCLTVQGDVTSLETTNLEVKDQLIELDKRADKTVPLAGYAGLYVDAYNGDTADKRIVGLVFDSDGVASVGHAKLDSNGLINTEEDNNLQPIATRVGFDNLTVDPMVKFNINRHTLVPADEGSDYLSSRSIIPAENLRGTIQASVVFQGTPIEGDYLANINACTITSGDLAFARVEAIAPSTVSGDPSTADYGVAEQLSRIDHTHSQYLTNEFPIELIGDVTASGPIGSPLETTISASAVTTVKIADGNVTDEKIDSVSAEKINAGTIGSSTKIVDLYGNALTASNLSKAAHKGILYQSAENTTSTLGGNTSQVLIQGETAPQWTNQENITAGNIYGGKRNDLLYQSGQSQTDFLSAPSSPIQNTLTYSGNELVWVNTNTLHVEEAKQAITVCINTGISSNLFLMGVRNQNGFQTPESSMIKVVGTEMIIGNNSSDGNIAVGASGSHFDTVVKANANAMNNKSNGNGFGANINVFLPSEDGNIDTVEQRNKKLEEYLPLIGGTLTGSLAIHTDTPQLEITNSIEENTNKSMKIVSNTYDNSVLNVLETISNDNDDTIYVGGTGSNGQSPDKVVLNIAAQNNTTDKKTIATASVTGIQLGNSVNILPGNSNNIGSSDNTFVNIYSDNYFEGSVNISTIYPRDVQDETDSTIPVLVAEGDSETPSTVITGVSISDGLLHYTTGILPVDDMVQQNHITDNNLHPLLIANINGTENTDGTRDQVNYNNTIYVKPSDSELYIQTIKSVSSTPTQLFGNASTATKAAAVYDDNDETSATRVIVATSIVEERTPEASANTLVYRDSSANFSANKIFVEELESSDPNGEAHLIGRADIATLADDATYAYNLKDVNDSTHTRSAATIITELEEATHQNTGSTIVKRDANGNFAATVITAALSGNASSATILETSRNFYITGGATSDISPFNGSADVSLNVTAVQPNVIVAGTIGTESSKVDLIGNAKTATTATHLAGGEEFSIPYQSASSNTSFIPWMDISEIPSAQSEFLLVATNRETAPGWIRNPYLHIDGHDTMTGALRVIANQNTDSYDSYGISMNNSNIGKVHGIYFNQNYEEVIENGETVNVAIENTVDQGIHFFRDETHVDTIYSKLSKLYYSPNRTLGASNPAEHEIIHAGNHLDYLANTNITDIGTNGTNIQNYDINLVGSVNSSTTLLSVARGGTGASTFTLNNILIGNGTSPIAEISIGGSLEYLRVNASADGYEYHALGSMSEEDAELWEGNESINTVGTIATGTWEADRVSLDYLDENVKGHIDDDTLHVPTASVNGQVLIAVADSSVNRAWTNKVLVGENDVTINAALSVNGSVNISGNTYISGQVTLGSGITVAGSTTVVDATTLSTSDVLVEIGKGNASALTTLAGIYIPNYDGKNAGAMVFDHNGTAYVGDVTLNAQGYISTDEKQYDPNDNGKLIQGNDLQPIATRLSTLEDGSIVKWDNSAKTLIAAVPAVDYVPALSGSENVENTYYVTNVNSNGLVTGGETTLDITSSNVTGCLPGSRIEYIPDSEDPAKINVSTALDDIYGKLSNIAGGITATINISGDVTGEGTIEEGITISINASAVKTDHIDDGAVTDAKIDTVSASKILAGTIGASDNIVNLYGNASTATTASVANTVAMSASTSGYLAVTSSSAGNNTIGATGISVNQVSSDYVIYATASRATMANAIKAEVPAAIPGTEYFYAANKTLAFTSGGSTSNTYISLDNAQISNSGSIVQLVTNTNKSTYALTGLRFKSGVGGTDSAYVDLTTTQDANGVREVDISNLLPTSSTFTSEYVTLKTTQNIPTAKSFGSGITLGDNNSISQTVYSSNGCTMKYNTTKKCVQFIFTS